MLNISMSQCENDLHCRRPTQPRPPGLPGLHAHNENKLSWIHVDDGQERHISSCFMLGSLRPPVTSDRSKPLRCRQRGTRLKARALPRERVRSMGRRGQLQLERSIR